MTGRPLIAEEFEERLEEHVDAVLSSRRTAARPALRLAEFDRTRQDFVLKWVDTIAKTHAEMAYQFADYASLALRRVDSEGVEAWIIQAMDAFDKKGLIAGIAVLQDLQAFAAQRKQRATGLSFEAIQGVLENFINGLGGRRLRLGSAAEIYTDTDTLFLPDFINQFCSRDENFRLFKAMAVHQWAQSRYGISR
jgi:nitric oxide reductase NorD protein